MDAKNEFDWLRSSTEDRKQLYVVTKRLMDTTGLSLDQVTKAALGFTYADSYDDNFRAGRMAIKYCGDMHRWMREKYPQFADELDQALNRPAPALPPLPRSAIRRLQRYAGAKHLHYHGQEPAYRDVPPHEVARALAILFGAENNEKLAVSQPAEMDLQPLKKSVSR